jgi:hypothetical protein
MPVAVSMASGANRMAVAWFDMMPVSNTVTR